MCLSFSYGSLLLYRIFSVRPFVVSWPYKTSAWHMKHKILFWKAFCMYQRLYHCLFHFWLPESLWNQMENDFKIDKRLHESFLCFRQSWKYINPIRYEIMCWCFFDLHTVPFTYFGVHHYGFWQIESYKYHHNQDRTFYHCDNSFVSPLCRQTVHPALTPGNHWCFSIVKDLLFLECHIKKIIECVIFSVWLPAFSIMHLWFIHANVYINSSLHYWVVVIHRTEVPHLFIC